KDSDPMLEIKVKAKFKHGHIENIQEIIAAIEPLKGAMYGEGRLFFSVANDINFEIAKDYGDKCVEEGTYPNGAVAKNNNIYTRFITRMLMKAYKKVHTCQVLN